MNISGFHFDVTLADLADYEFLDCLEVRQTNFKPNLVDCLRFHPSSLVPELGRCLRF
jgi:hypothetical protein